MKYKFLLLLAIICVPGCFDRNSDLELISIAQQGIVSAQRNNTKTHTQLINSYKLAKANLAIGFDNDVKLIEAGKILDSEGKPLGLNSQWIISSRKGYAKALEILDKSIEEENRFYIESLDNLSAASQALELIKKRILSSQKWESKTKLLISNIVERKSSNAKNNSTGN